ncbi:MerR family transcriptional regulator [Mycolicibacterium anyangense]|uniref:MerR family transcriptional regulator n=1 Tax=Mycolicibacterium anyangense TaxID=1431246 RepID=A0A6N4W788_9MYCO|nr:MerR family transcriptional regulator [Mycolicibacterium anyangense]BBZ75987.1 MerR family transcriptional regulator [Mycolicibacterium anyangense]
MYSIGAFAKLGGVSVRMLRHYDRVGVLVPAEVAPATGRRSYHATQLPQLNQLVALKHLGFTLDQIRGLLAESVDPAKLRSMLRDRAAELETRVLRDAQTLDRLRARLRLIEIEAMAAISGVEIKQLAPQRVAALMQSVSSADDVDEFDVESLFEHVIAVMDAAGLDRAAPVSWRDDDPPTLRLYAGYLLPSGDVPGLVVQVLPAATVASVVRRGAVADMYEAHQTISHWAHVHGRIASVERGRWRELYLETNDADYSDWLVEVQLELDEP